MIGHKYMDIRNRIAENGFESNSDYELEIKCLLDSPTDGVRTLNVQGERGRHKTAFANALARALSCSEILYFDFSSSQEQEDRELEREMRHSQSGEEGKFVPPVRPLDKIFSDACAYSESRTTCLILDQIQHSLFKDQIRLYKFVCKGTWIYPGAEFLANPKNMLVMLISEEALYHSLQKHSYRIWIDDHGMRQQAFNARELGYDQKIEPLIEGLSRLFTEIGTMPTLTEFKKLLNDLIGFVRNERQISSAIFGRVGGIDREFLRGENMKAHYKMLWSILENTLAIEHIDCDREEPDNSQVVNSVANPTTPIKKRSS